MSSEILTRVRAARHDKPEHGPTPDPVRHDITEDARFAEWLEGLRTELAQSLNGAVLRGARPVPIKAGSAGVRPVASGSSLLGWSVRETAGAAATIIVYDGQDVSGVEIASIVLVAGESARDWFGPGGVSVGEQGLYVAVTGSVAGSIYLGGTR